MLANANINHTFMTIINSCFNGTQSHCMTILSGDNIKKNAILKLIDARKSSETLESLYIDTYGLERYKEFITAFNLKITPIDYSEFSVIKSDINSAIFKNKNEAIIRIFKDNDIWKLDLDNSTFLELDNSQLTEFVNLTVGTQARLIELIEAKVPVETVYKTGGLYYLAIIYPFVSENQRSKFNAIFEKKNKSFTTVKKEILTAMADKVRK